MLVLTWMTSEEIRIGDDVIVRVLDIKGDRVRIGIEAPSEIPVHRQEVYAAIERANREAMEVASAGLEGAQELMNKDTKGTKDTKGGGTTQPQKGANPSRPGHKHMEVKHGT